MSSPGHSLDPKLLVKPDCQWAKAAVVTACVCMCQALGW